jgi:hypothetical protein
MLGRRRWQLLATVAVLGCSNGPALYSEPWPEANALFLDDPRWIGGDGAYSVDLGGDRVLWLFGDSYIALDDERRRDTSVMVRNSLAVQTGYDPTRAFIRYYYGHADGVPKSYLPEQGEFWLWPGHGVRIEDTLLLFYGRLHQAGEGMWGFATDDWTAFLIDNPDAEPSEWTPREVLVPDVARDVQLGEAVLHEGGFVYVYGGQGRYNEVVLARFAVADVLQGDLRGAEWWTGSGYGAAKDRKAIIDIGAPEFSVHFATELGRYVYVETAGFGGTTLAVRTAERREGPFSEPRDVLRPPESFAPEPFVYAGKAHPELVGADLALTYVPSAFEDGPPDPDEVYYYPRFAKLYYR